MIINCDAKALEWYAGTYLSKDIVAKQEILDGVDQHTQNQIVFKLPGWEDASNSIHSDERQFGRLISKKFVFRLMYGGSAYAYANDPDFTEVSRYEDYWQNVIDTFYQKYYGFAQWHYNIVKEVKQTGKLILPTGRIYEYQKTQIGMWPETTIKNYPVQGLGADIMSIARVSFYNRFKRANFDAELVNTVHDSIVIDSHEKHIEEIAYMLHSVFDDLPANFERVFKVGFDLPLKCEVSFGNNMKELKEISLDIF